MQVRRALVANLDLFQSGQMEGLDVVNAMKSVLHHVPKAKLVTCAVVILGTTESVVKNAL